jgi:hypothetical protein
LRIALFSVIVLPFIEFEFSTPDRWFA